MNSINKYLYIIKSNNILKQIFKHLKKKKIFKIISYNNHIQKRLDLGINDYKYYFEKIEIEIIPKTVHHLTFYENYFINRKYSYEPYYHIYFDDKKEEINMTHLTKDDKIKRIKIIIDYEIKSFDCLFFNCEII